MYLTFLSMDRRLFKSQIIGLRNMSIKSVQRALMPLFLNLVRNGPGDVFFLVQSSKLMAYIVARTQA